MRITYANVTSTLALLVALGTGTAYAAVQITSSSQISPGVIQGSDIKNGSIGSQQVKGLKGGDIRPGSIGSTEVAGISGSDIKNATIGAPQIKPNSIGPQQVKGLTNADISDDTVRGFARLRANYTIDQAYSENFILHTSGGGFYCLEWTAGTPSSAMATIDVGGADTSKSQVAVNVDPSIIATTSCPAGTNMIATTSLIGADYAIGLPFYLWVLG